MSYKEQVKLRLKLIDAMINVYQAMPHQIGIPSSEVNDTISALIVWKNETELLLNSLTSHDEA